MIYAEEIIPESQLSLAEIAELSKSRKQSIIRSERSNKTIEKKDIKKETNTSTERSNKE